MLSLHGLLPTICLLAALALPGAAARIAFQLAMDWDAPGKGFPGVVRGGLALAGSVSLGLCVGLFVLSVPKLAGWEFAAAIATGFGAQDLFVFLVKRGKRYRENPKALFDDLRHLK